MKTFLLFLMIYILHTTTKISHDMEKGPKSVVSCMRKRSEWNELKRIRDGRLHTLNWILKIIKLTACNHFSAKYRVAVKIFSLSNSIYIMVGEQQRLEYKLMSCKDKHKVQKKTQNTKKMFWYIFSRIVIFVYASLYHVCQTDAKYSWQACCFILCVGFLFVIKMTKGIMWFTTTSNKKDISTSEKISYWNTVLNICFG